MADFCRQCAKDVDPLWPGDDFARLVMAGRSISVLCEGCGWTWVDKDGNCIGPCHNPSHKRKEEPHD